MALNKLTRGLNQLSQAFGSRVGGASFAPSSLPGYVDSPFSFAQLRAAGNLWQNTAQTIPAVANGDPIRRAVCGSTNWDAPTDAARPLLFDEGGGKWSASFDGVDDSLAGGATSFTGATSFYFRALQSVAAGATRLLRSGSTNSLVSPRRAGLSFAVVGSSVLTTVIVADSNPHTYGIQKAAAANWGLRLDGAAVGGLSANSSDWGTVGIGAGGGGGGGSETFTGRIAGLATYTTALSASDILLLEAYLGAL